MSLMVPQVRSLDLLSGDSHMGLELSDVDNEETQAKLTDNEES